MDTVLCVGEILKLVSFNLKTDRAESKNLVNQKPKLKEKLENLWNKQEEFKRFLKQNRVNWTLESTILIQLNPQIYICILNSKKIE